MPAELFENRLCALGRLRCTARHVTVFGMTQTATHIPTATQLPQVHLPRNPGMALDLDWVAKVQANT